MLKSYKELMVWQKSIELVVEIYKLTEKYPKQELFGLVNQMRRAVISIPSNIAEGYQRKGLGEYINFLSIASGSAAELDTQIIISKKIYKNENYNKSEILLVEIQKMLAILMQKLKLK